MAFEVTVILERFLTHEFVVLMDGIILAAQATGLFFFVKGVFMWLALMRVRSSSPMMSQLYNAPPSPNLIMAMFLASTFLWKFGEGIAMWGSMFWSDTTLDFNTPYSSAMFGDISQRTKDLVNLTTVGGGASNTQIAVRACFAIMGLFGAVSYFRGILGITYLANPQLAGKITFGQIMVHCIFGILLVYTDYFYQSVTNTFAGAMR